MSSNYEGCLAVRFMTFCDFLLACALKFHMICIEIALGFFELCYWVSIELHAWLLGSDKHMF